MKHIKLYEAKYQTYADYEKSGKWGSKEDLKNDAILSVRKQIPNVTWPETESYIKSVTDQSDPKQGIKFEFVLKDGNTIHAFKTGNFRGSWEFYLNKKKIKPTVHNNGLWWELFDTMSPLEQYTRSLWGHDWYFNYADDNRSYQAGSAAAKQLNTLYNKLSPSDKKKAYKAYLKKVPKDLKRDFKRIQWKVNTMSIDSISSVNEIN